MYRSWQTRILDFSILVFISGFWFSNAAHALQVVSPGSAPQTHQRNMAAAAAAASGDEAQNVEPSRRLLISMNSVIPFEVIGSEIEAPLQEAARKFLTGSVPEAIKGLEGLREKHSDLPPVPLLMANMLYALGNRDQGRQWLEKSVIDFPDDPTAYLGFARVSAADKRIADADVMLEKVSRLVEAGSWTDGQQKFFRIEYLDILTDVFVNRQQLIKARDCLLELRELLVSNGKIPIRLAQIEFDLGNVDASVNYLRDALVLETNIRKPEVIIAEWFLRKKNFAQSEEWIRQAAGKYPDDAAVQIDYGRWLLQNEKIAEARAVVGKAERLGGNEYIIGYLNGQLAFAQRSYEIAESHFDQLLKLKPGDADAMNMLSLSLIESADIRKHSRALELAMMNQRLYPQSPTAMATLGWIYYRSGKNADAEKAFRAVVASNNLAPAAAYYVATYLNERGDFAGARNLLEKAVTSQEYFMFRRAAEDLLQSLSVKTPKDPKPSEGEASDEAGSQDDGKQQ